MNRSRMVRAVGVFLAGSLIALGARATMAAPATREGKAIDRVKVVTETAPHTIDLSQSSFVDLPGATTPIAVADGSSAHILVRFSAESDCGGRVAAWCSVQIKVADEEGSPVSGTTFAFDTVEDDGIGKYEAHAMERVVGPFTAGAYTVRVRWAMVLTDSCPCAGTSKFRLDDWTLVVERIKA